MTLVNKILKLLPTRNKIKTMDSSDPDFRISDGFVSYPRAEIKITAECPAHYREMLQRAYNNGWIKPVANMYDYEYTMDMLKENT